MFMLLHLATWAFWLGLSFYGQGYTATIAPELDYTSQTIPLNFLLHTRIPNTGANWRMANYTFEGFTMVAYVNNSVPF